jgi:hypothetical protein
VCEAAVVASWDVDNARAAEVSRCVVHVQPGLLGQLWSYVIAALLLAFVVSIINDTARSQLLKEASAASEANAKVRVRRFVTAANH